ncbi:helY putative ATP-dependent RNA helicase [Actinoplanes missouriensis 431]|uniref:HelY putative ATP-dependent RNA helicase n=1 Tax=Actinoplanes missouriensis (strain ATCC 14538 / DSM 43046 / CBS 188.64 / JCM 3121 / NBRC 102363 / NCIMB 12654 / NRRL B-3342 / UNCC 431) TaxID=512565 RepID=I0HC27_ACTM4|nr:DEAD/DEAH box helicase [Actinoplanes missouriensis]BAL90564.1 helY putative ATP-dependent RNA helicase [Actinoplanes missouriensis 431]
MTSPAERYAASQRRAARVAEFPALEDFMLDVGFDLDDFQREACEVLERGNGVLVCAPTGAGKTVVGEFAVHLALRSGERKCFYTTPIKALSNQKYNDLVARYGADKVGLLTGDNAINGDAPVVVMTTEVLRNMLYSGSDQLRNLAYVVMDEVHYLADRFRGAVWEEVIIHLPASVTLVSLSATVSNYEEFADWLVTVRGKTEVVVSEHRPVPLWQHMLVGRRMFDLFHDADAAKKHDVHPELLRYTREMDRRLDLTDRAGSGWSGRGGRSRRWQPPPRAEVVERLERAGLLPAILFIFSRAACDAAVQQCLAAGLRLTGPDERAQIREIAQAKVANIPAEDLSVLGYWEWLDGLERGVAAHHAGMLPAFKEAVEECFVRGLVKAVFATETLALGINMPARCVVLERLVKFNGEAHVDLTPGEYTQLTGRAGRRGIDVEGHAVVLWSPDVDPRHVAGLASTRTYPLRSSFRPSYNMAVNLVGTVGAERSRALLESSFAQFQADRSVVGLARQVQRNEETMQTYSEDATCHHGDFEEYFGIRVAIADREKSLSRQGVQQRRSAAVAALEKLRIGDVIRVPNGKRAGLAVVLEPVTGGFGEPRPLVLTQDRWAGRVSPADFGGPVDVLARVRVPKNFNHRSPAARRDLAAQVSGTGLDRHPDRRRRSRQSPGEDAEIALLKVRMRQHPCHACPEREDHARWAERRHRLLRDTDALRDKVAGRTGSLARTFDQVCAVLTTRGYLSADGEVTDAGRTLGRIWSEADLLVAECLRQGVWDGLAPDELAAAVSMVLYESRRESEDRASVPKGPITAAVDACAKLWGEIAADEAEHGLTLTREPDPGFVWPMYRWARGEPLARVLASGHQYDADMPAGDFVRWARQVLDLLGQIREAGSASPSVKETARKAISAVNRGVLALQRGL